jgi:uncharacterized protein YndB with AHSA1/START domain
MPETNNSENNHFEINNTVEIGGTLDQVWQTLIDFARYREWNPTIRDITGTLAVGNDVLLSVAQPDGGERQWKVQVSKFDPQREYGWTFFENSPELYGGEHTFRLEPIDERTTRYIDRETFHGSLLPDRQQDLGTKTQAGMNAMGAALKQRVEDRPAPDVRPRPASA